jgi:hypothetical protein
MFGAIQLQWGWAVLIIGAIVVIIAGFLKQEVQSEAADEPAATIARVLGDNRIFVGVIGAISLLAIGLVTVNYISSSSTVQKATRSVAETVFPDSSVVAMENALAVDFVGKDFEKADYESGTYMDSISVDFTFRNMGAKDITGFKGTVEFKDMFDDPINSVNLSYDEGIKAGQTKKWNGSLRYNQFLDEDTKFKNVAADKLRFKFLPQAIHFADGTKLEKAPK